MEVQKPFPEIRVVGEGADDVCLAGVFLVDSVYVLQVFWLILFDPFFKGLQQCFGSFGQKCFFLVDLAVRVGLYRRVVSSTLGLFIFFGIHLPSDSDSIRQPQNLSSDFDKGNLDQISFFFKTIVILNDRHRLTLARSCFITLL